MSNYPLLTVLRDDQQPEDYDPCDGCKGWCEDCPVWPYVKPKWEDYYERKMNETERKGSITSYIVRSNNEQ